MIIYCNDFACPVCSTRPNSEWNELEHKWQPVPISAVAINAKYREMNKASKSQYQFQSDLIQNKEYKMTREQAIKITDNREWLINNLEKLRLLQFDEPKPKPLDRTGALNNARLWAQGKVDITELDADTIIKGLVDLIDNDLLNRPKKGDALTILDNSGNFHIGIYAK